ncbi:MAG TPA: rRNA maturation RNase YbeY [Candidatus Goldiibacteriota bacterium]|nr:rRNA maturation RNase YbeY [Candidatus Goldiibacteriota bacterium]
MKSKTRVNVFYKKKVFIGFDVSKTAEKLLALEKKNNTEVNIIFAGSSFIKEMNLNYRMKNTDTDVISFENEGGGEIYISVDRAKTDAAELGITLKEEYLRLLIHGLLHVIGYDHIKDADFKKMNIKEKKYLEVFYKKGV